VTSLDLLSNYLLIVDLRFDAMVCSNLGNENSDTGHIKCLRGQQVPQPALNNHIASFNPSAKHKCWIHV